MDVEEVFQFMNRESLAVLATVADNGQPQAALMGFAVTCELEIIFDSVKTSRKYPNLKKNPRVAWVIGCATEVTVQYEGSAQELEGESVLTEASYAPSSVSRKSKLGGIVRRSFAAKDPDGRFAFN